MVLMAVTEEKPNRKERRNRNPVMKVEYEAIVTNKDGKVISQTKGIAHSFTKQFIQMMALYFGIVFGSAPATISVPETVDGTGRTWPYTTTTIGYLLACAGPSANSLYGIVVGSGAGSTSINDYTLGSQIAHGSTAGLLVHNAQTIEAVVVAPPIASVRMTRTFTNNTANPITVYEIGWYWAGYDSGVTERYFCILHDLLASPQAVPAGATLTVRYTISTSN